MFFRRKTQAKSLSKLRLTRLLLVVTAMAFAFPLGQAQMSQSQKRAVDDLLSSYLARHRVPGLSVAIIANGEVLYTQGYGFADVENSVPASADTVYRLASVSKPITATAAMELVERKKLDLDAPIQNYCPAFPRKQWTITTRQLLSHESGIRDYNNDQETLNTRHYSSIKEALSQFQNDPLQFEPATKMQYSSYGYVVLGCVLEGAAGSTYAQYMQRAIFGPAGMDHTLLDDVFAIVPHRARGYQITTDGVLQNSVFVDVSNKPPGSGLNSSARDMGAFVASLYSGHLVSPRTLTEMMSPVDTRDGKPTIYGLGFYTGGPVGRYRDLLEVGHGGDQQGFSCALELLPEKRFGVVLLSNLEDHHTSLDFIDLSHKIYDIVSPDQ